MTRISKILRRQAIQLWRQNVGTLKQLQESCKEILTLQTPQSFRLKDGSTMKIGPLDFGRCEYFIIYEE